MARPISEAAGRLEETYRQHAPSALALAYLLTGDQREGEDLVQDAFVKLMGRFRHMGEPERFAHYLRRTVVNLHLSRVRRLLVERKHASHVGTDAEGHVDLPDVATRQDLWSALRRLPRRQRAVLVLRYYEDLSERDAAAALHCSVAAVKSLTSRAVANLRDLVEEVG